MDEFRMDTFAKFFANRRLSRRQTLAATASSVAAGVLVANAVLAQEESTPDLEEFLVTYEPDHSGPMYLYVQTFHTGTIVPKKGEDGTYTITLEQGSGQTIYFADRPSRNVGVFRNRAFLSKLGFFPDDRPNAALILDTGHGEMDIAVVELSHPVITDDERGISYDVAVLADWQDEFDFGDQQASADLASLAPEFDAAYLFIDDCPSGQVQCYYDTDSGHLREKVGSPYSNDQIGGMCFTWNAFPPRCIPCVPGYHDENKTYDTTIDYWDSRCNTDHADECITAVGRRLCVAAWT